MQLKKLNQIKSTPVQVIGQDYIPFYLSNYTLIAGNGGVGKSLITLKMVVHYLMDYPDKQALCFFTEDTRDQIEERLDSIVYHLNITKEEVIDRTFFITIDEDDHQVFCRKEHNKIVKTDFYDSIIDVINENNIGMVVLDPFERFQSGLNESDESDMKEYVVLLQSIGVKTGCGVVVLHHTPKGNKGGFRGSGVIVNKCRLAYNLRKNVTVDTDSGIEVVRPGWERSIILSVIKDNNFVTKDCEIIQSFNGRLDLPVIRKEPKYNEDGSNLPF